MHAQPIFAQCQPLDSLYSHPPLELCHPSTLSPARLPRFATCTLPYRLSPLLSGHIRPSSPSSQSQSHCWALSKIAVSLSRCHPASGSGNFSPLADAKMKDWRLLFGRIATLDQSASGLIPIATFVIQQVLSTSTKIRMQVYKFPTAL